MPVDLAKKMNVDIVIAVYLDEGPPAADFKQSLVGIAGRTASIMIAANELHNLKLADILLSADLKGFSTGDFSSSAQIIPRGFAAAKEKEALLSRFSVSEDEWGKYLAQRRMRQRTTVPVPQFITVRGATDLEDSYVKSALSDQVGKPIDTAWLETKITDLNAQGAFESLRYAVVEDSSRKPGLAVFVAPKENKPPFIDLGLAIDGSDPNDVRFGVGARLTLINIGGYRSEWRTDVSVGNVYGISSEYYHPITGSSNWFIAPHAFSDKSRFDFYDYRNRTAEYSRHRTAAGLDLGYAIGHNAEIRVGEAVVVNDADLKLGTAIIPNYSHAAGDSSALFRYFGQDDNVIPHKGFSSETRLDWRSSSPFGGSYRSAETKSSLFLPSSKKGSVWFRADAGSAFGAKNLGLESFMLGGPFRLSAYGINELFGNQYMLFQSGYSYRIATFNPIFSGAIYGLAWFETGKMYGDPAATYLAKDGSIAIVAKTGLGPVFAGASTASAERVKWWFGLGHVF